MATFLISEKFIKTNSSINGSVDSGYFLPVIRQIHQQDLLMLLGTKLTNKVLKLVADGQINDAENIYYKRLIDEHLQGILLECFCATIYKKIMMKVTNGGLLKSTGEFEETISLEELRYLEREHLRNRDQRIKWCMDWICANVKHLPEYRMCEKGDVYPQKEAFRSLGL